MSKPGFTEEFLTKVARAKQISDSEMKALRLALENRKSKEIAKELGISEAATRKRLGEVYRKFEIEGKGPGKLASLEKVLHRQRLKAESGELTIGHEQPPLSRRLDTRYVWNDAPTLSLFQGRYSELDCLRGWVLRRTSQQKLLAICGMGGLGKSYLARKLAEGIKGHFHRVIWLTIQPNQKPASLLKRLLDILQDKPHDQLQNESVEGLDVSSELLAELPDKKPGSERSESEKSESEKLESQNLKSQKNKTEGLIRQVVKALSEQRCLVVLDEFEAVFKDLNADCSDADGSVSTFEASPTQQASLYKEGFEGYEDFLNNLKQPSFPPCDAGASCVVLTSREKLRELPPASVKSPTVLQYTLSRLTDLEAKALLGQFGLKNKADYQELWFRYDGHPMALQLAATAIKDVFYGKIRDFLDQEISVFDSLRKVIGTQFNRLSPLETEAMYWLAINHTLCSLEDLKADIVAEDRKQNLVYTLRSLERRFLVEVKDQGGALYGLHPIVSEYVLSRFVRQIFQDLTEESLDLFNSYALLKADAKDFLREFQRDYIVRPVLERLKNHFKSVDKVEQHLNSKLDEFKKNNHHRLGYAGGNFVNLMVELSPDELSAKDFSELMIWQAYLQDVRLRNVSFQSCELNRSVFTETVSDVMAIALNPILADKTTSLETPLLACGDTNGMLHLWQTDSDITRTGQGRKRAEWAAHSGWVRAIAFVPEQSLLVSGGEDSLLKLWQLPNVSEQPTPQAKQLWQQDTKNWVYTVAVSPDKKMIACGGKNQIALYRLEDGKEVYRLQNSVARAEVKQNRTAQTMRGEGLSRVRSLTFSSDGQWLASSGDDEVIRVWRVDSRAVDSQAVDSQAVDSQTVITLVEHTELAEHDGWVRSVCFCPDSLRLLSGSDDRTVRLWDIESGRCLQVFEQPGDRVRAVTVSPDGQFAASGGDDFQVFLWNLNTLERVKTLPTLPSRVWAVAFQQQGKKLLLAAGGDKQTLRLWQVDGPQQLSTGPAKQQTERLKTEKLKAEKQQILLKSAETQPVEVRQIRTYRGYTNGIRAVGFLNSQRIVSAGDNREISVWDTEQEVCKASLSLHQGRVWAIAIDRQNGRIASASDDHTVRLWDMTTGQCLTTLTAHTSWVRTVAFSARGRLLSSSGDDGTIRIWNAASGSCLTTLECGIYWVRAVCFDPITNRRLISGGEDGLVRLWDRKEAHCLRTLAQHTQRICSVAYSPEGKYIASGSDDKTVALWDVAQNKEIYRFEESELGIKAVAFSPDGRYLAAGGEDQLVYVWDIASPDKTCFTLRPKDYTGGSGGIRSVAFSPDSRRVISGGLDEIIRVGDLEMLETEEVHFLRPLVQHARPYEKVKIAEVKGLSGLQKANLLSLGAVDRTEPLLL